MEKKYLQRFPKTCMGATTMTKPTLPIHSTPAERVAILGTSVALVHSSGRQIDRCAVSPLLETARDHFEIGSMGGVLPTCDLSKEVVGALDRVRRNIGHAVSLQYWSKTKAEIAASNAIYTFNRVNNAHAPVGQQIVPAAIAVLGQKYVPADVRKHAIVALEKYAKAGDVPALVKLLERSQSHRVALSDSDLKGIWTVIGEVGRHSVPLLPVGQFYAYHKTLGAHVLAALDAVAERESAYNVAHPSMPRRSRSASAPVVSVPVAVKRLVPSAPVKPVAPVNAMASMIKPAAPKVEEDRKIDVPMDVWNDWYLSGKTGELYRKGMHMQLTGPDAIPLL